VDDVIKRDSLMNVEVVHVVVIHFKI
jgi:hypothetical protein